MNIEIEFNNRCEVELPDLVRYNNVYYKLTYSALMAGGFRIDYVEYDGNTFIWDNYRLISMIEDDMNIIINKAFDLLDTNPNVLPCDQIESTATNFELESSDISFEKELTLLLNKYCKENASNTPDHILANYLLRSLDTFNHITNKRENHYGR